MSVTLTSAGITISVNWNVQATNSGAPATPNSGSWNPKLSFTNGSSAGQATDWISVINTLAGGANSTYDLTATFADLVGTNPVSMNTVRIFVIWLLSTTQTGPDGATVGTASSCITWGNAASAQAFTATQPNGILGASSGTVNVPNGGFNAFGVGSAGAFTAGSSNKNLKVLNQDGSNTATFALIFANT